MDHPGQLYIVVTLLPLLSFLLLLIGFGVRAYLHTHRKSVPGGDSLYDLLGGATPGKGAAYIATAAIFGSFLLSLYGFMTFAKEQHAHEANITEVREGKSERIKKAKADLVALEEKRAKSTEETERKKLRADIETLKEQISPAGIEEAFEHRWAGSFNWADLYPKENAEAKKSHHGPGSKPGSLLQLGFRIDSLSSTMFLMVTFIATLIHLFSMGYMSEELQRTVEDHHVHGEHGHYQRRGRFGRFFLFLSLFCFSMLNLILANNLFQVFVSWELVGICSFLLIGFYYERQSASNAANKAFITNRVGDAGFVIGLLIVWTYLGTFNFEEMFARIRVPVGDAHGEALPFPTGTIVRGDLLQNDPKTLEFSATGAQALLFPGHLHAADLHGEEMGEGADKKVSAAKTLPVEPGRPVETDFGTIPYWLLVVAGLGIFLGCVGKSAQFPLQVWLPDAMEGPTPVSALIHAATMVAAGVYLVGRCFPLFTPETRIVIAYTGAITLFVAATIAIVMTDIKKVLAYSTVSQLGYMMLALGIGGWAAGLFHLLTHAFFKALLFLGSGSVIYGCHHEQEMTKMGGLWRKMPITAFTMLAGVLAIAGIPLFSGWYSKDAILAQAAGFIRVHPQHGLLFVLPLLTAGITTFYMFRMWFMTFTGKPRDAHVYDHAHESPRLMTLPLILLGICSVIVAWGPKPWDAEGSALEHHLHHSQPAAVAAEFGVLHPKVVKTDSGAKLALAPGWYGALPENYDEHHTVAHWAHTYHHSAGNLALLVVGLAIAFAAAVYHFKVLDPAEAKAQVPGLHRFLSKKWYFDELYSVLLVRPALEVAHWCKNADLKLIDGFLHSVSKLTLLASRWDGWFDSKVVDGLVNVTASTFHGLGSKLRHVQTGYLRSYIVFLVLAVVGVFFVLAYLVTLAGSH